MRNNLARLGGYPIHRVLLLLCVYVIKQDDALTEISPFEAKEIDINT